MIENDYPIPSYMADVFQNLTGWVETPQLQEITPGNGKNGPKQRIFAIDCEMVCICVRFLPTCMFK
jgi:RNA exonuclease 1